MPIRKKGFDQELVSNTYGCKNCGKPISYNISQREYCLECSIKYGHVIREKKKQEREFLEQKLKEVKEKAK